MECRSKQSNRLDFSILVTSIATSVTGHPVYGQLVDMTYNSQNALIDHLSSTTPLVHSNVVVPTEQKPRCGFSFLKYRPPVHFNQHQEGNQWPERKDDREESFNCAVSSFMLDNWNSLSHKILCHMKRLPRPGYIDDTMMLVQPLSQKKTRGHLNSNMPTSPFTEKISLLLKFSSLFVS